MVAPADTAQNASSMRDQLGIGLAVVAILMVLLVLLPPFILDIGLTTNNGETGWDIARRFGEEVEQLLRSIVG